MIDSLYDSTCETYQCSIGQQPLPLISIGITCFNASTTIERAIDSALSQSWPNFEIIVADDGSSDGCREILKRRADTEPRLRVINHALNRGCAAARNTLVEAARGEYLAFFDDDDVSRSDRLRLQYQRIVDYEQEVGTKRIACYTSGNRIYPNGYVLPIHAVGTNGLPPIETVMADYLLFHKRRPGVFYGGGTPTCSLMARTTVFRDLGGFDVAMRRQEDVDFAIRLSFDGGHFIGVPEPVLTQYASTGSEKSALVEFESFLQLLDKNADYLRLTDSYRYMRLWSEMRYRHFSGQDGLAVVSLTRLLLTHPLRTVRHFALSATRRFRHELRMKM